jgi:hypothetical protein
MIEAQAPANAIPKSFDILQRVTAHGCPILDLPALALASQLVDLDVLRQLKHEFTNTEWQSVLAEDQYAGFDFVMKSRQFGLEDVIRRCHPLYDIQFRDCVITGPYARDSVLRGFAGRFHVACSMSDVTSLPKPDARIGAIYGPYLCFARPRDSESEPLRIATCALETIFRRTEISASLGCDVAIELVPLEVVIAAWRSGAEIDLMRLSNALHAASSQQVFCRPRTADPSFTPEVPPYTGHWMRDLAEFFPQIAWTNSLNAPPADSGSIDHDPDATHGNDRVDDGEEQILEGDESGIVGLLQRIFFECHHTRHEWFDITIEQNEAVLRYGVSGWSIVRDRLPLKLMPALHAMVGTMTHISTQVGGRGRVSLPMPHGKVDLSIWIAPKRELTRGNDSAVSVVQVRFEGLVRASNCVESIDFWQSLIQQQRLMPSARVIILSVQSEQSVIDFSRGLRRFAPFSHMREIAIPFLQRSSSVSKVAANYGAEGKLEALLRCEPVAPTVVSILNARRPDEVDEVLRIARSGSYVLVRIQSTCVELSVLQFLSWSSDRSIAAGLLLSAVHVDEVPLLNQQRDVAISQGKVDPKDSVRVSTLMRITPELREALAVPTTVGQIARTGCVSEFRD